ncbi:MAG: hypothetical protein AAGD00_05740 [Planctomycetota bacterium]
MRGRTRKGVAVASAVIILVVVNLAIVGITVGTRDDSVIAAQKADTARAFYTAENGVRVVATEIAEGRDVPEGTLTLADGFTIDVTLLDDDNPVTVRITGRTGSARRMIEVGIE